jgi:hypothetical protein
MRDKYLEETKMKCNMCKGQLKHYHYNGVFIWVCCDCPNIQFELWNDIDIVELTEFLKLKE